MNSGHASDGLREKWEPILTDFGLDLGAEFDGVSVDDAILKSKQISRAFQESRKILDFVTNGKKESEGR